MTNQEKYIAHESRMQKLRWATPAGLFLLTIALGISGWIAVDYLTQIRNAISDLKTDTTSHYTALWVKINDITSKEQSDIKCLNENFRKCESCRNADVC